MKGLTGSVTYSMVATDDELWAGTRTSGVFRTSSTDWHPDIDGLNENGIQVISMAKSGDDVYVDALGGVYYQGDTSWLRFNSLDQHFISCVAASGNNIYAGTGSAIYISRDKGTSWTKGAIPEQGIQGIWADGDEVWAAGQYLYKSTDRGLTWYQVEVKPPNRQGSAIQGMWCVVKKGADLYLGSNGGVFYSPDNGTTWLQNSYDNPNGAQSVRW
ncbi:MAG: sialidase family protein [Bacteroidota bacterium]